MSDLPLWAKKSLDLYLKEKGRLSDDQMAEIKRVRTAEGGGWAGHFVDAGCISENELLQLIVEETNLPYFQLMHFNPSDAVVQEFTRDFLTTFECFPVDRIGPVLTLATPNPFQSELFTVHGRGPQEIYLMLCRVSEWRECMRRTFEAADSLAAEGVFTT
jgi:hypothetical protein